MAKKIAGKVLVTDDTAANRYALVRVLQLGGYEVLEAETGAAALELAQSAQPEVIVMDVKLPDMIGFEATARLKSNPATAHIPVLQVSASYTNADARALGLDTGADAYLTLPIEPQVLIATVAALLRLHRAERELREAVHSRDEFLSIASHDLRTPLTSIQLTLELVMRSLARSEDEICHKIRPHLERISGQTKRLGMLLENLLDISQISAGRVSLNLEAVDLAELAREVVNRYQEAFRNAGCSASVSVEDELVGQWDRLRLDQVVSNLVTNAIKYGAGQPIEVRVAKRDDGTALLSVRDRGIGIAPEQQARIFQRFERAQRGRETGSYGLGLWIVKNIVEAFGGQVRVASVVGEGSTFSLELPLAGPARQGEEEESDHAEPHRAAQ